jgi:hypothetical protein
VDTEFDALVLVVDVIVIIVSLFLVKIITNVIAIATPIKIVTTTPKIIRFNMLLVGTTRLKYLSILIYLKCTEYTYDIVDRTNYAF